MSQEKMIRLSVFLIMLTTFSLSGYFRSKADRSDQKISLDQENQLLLKIRSAAAIVMYGSVLVYLINPNWMRWAQLESLPMVVRWVGVGLLVLLIPAFYWQLSSLGRNITKTVATRTEHQLVTSGPYKFVRHPLYSLGFIFITGIAVAMGSWFIMLLAILTWIPLALRTPLEEEKLIEAFGDEYREYMKRTGRYLPKLFKG